MASAEATSRHPAPLLVGLDPAQGARRRSALEWSSGSRAESQALTSLTLLGGLLLGLASSLHCAGMCGGVGASLALTLAPAGGSAARLRALGLAQLGKLVSYMTAGAVLGASGALVYGLFDRAAGFAVLQRVSALVLIWTALSLVGVLPAPSVLGRMLRPLSRWAARTRRADHPAAALAAGLVWGLLPCGMVYAALMYAMLAGDALHGALVMAGFGIGVSPLLTASSAGAALLAGHRHGPAMRWAACVALIAFALAALVWPASAGILCRPG